MTCSVSSCGRLAAVDGYCQAHYARVQRDGDLQVDKPLRSPRVDVAVCSVRNCDRPSDTRGWCRAHYHRWFKTGDVLAAVPLAPRKVMCIVDDCDRPARSRRHCQKHSERVRRTGTTDPAARREPEPRVTSQGYVQVWRDGGYVLQHRLAWEEAHGPLLPRQNVHHRNGDRADNRLENLEIWDTSQPAGQRPVDKVQFAIEVLRRYAPHLLNDPHEGTST